MKPGTLIKLSSSTRRVGRNAGQVGVIVGYDRFSQFRVLINGEIIKYHETQIEEEL